MQILVPERVIQKVKEYRAFMLVAQDEQGASSVDERVMARHYARDCEMQIAAFLDVSLEEQEKSSFCRLYESLNRIINAVQENRT